MCSPTGPLEGATGEIWDDLATCCEPKYPINVMLGFIMCENKRRKRGKCFVSYTPDSYHISNVYVMRTSRQFEGYPEMDSTEHSSEATGGWPNWLENIEEQANWNSSSLSLVSQRMLFYIRIIKDWKNATLSYFIPFFCWLWKNFPFRPN